MRYRVALSRCKYVRQKKLLIKCLLGYPTWRPPPRSLSFVDLSGSAYALRGITIIRILVVDDYEPFRRLICSVLQQKADFEIVGQVSDGLESVAKAEELQPDLILLDIALPTLNGIQTAMRVRNVAPKSRILFLSQESSSDVVQEALETGALGYLHKARVRTELLPAIEAVLAGRQFVGIPNG